MIWGQKINVAEQTQKYLKILKNLMKEGALLSDVVDVTSFLVGMNDFAEYNKAYSEFFNKSNGPKDYRCSSSITTS